MITAFILATVLCLIRISAFVAFLPPISGKNMPNLVKIGLSVAITLCIAPQYAADIVPELVKSGAHQGWLKLSILALREFVYGAAMAWMFGLCMVPVRIAGAYVAQEMGLTLGGLTSPTDQQPSNVISSALEGLAVTLFFCLNLHHIAISSLGLSFARQPIAGFDMGVLWIRVLSVVSKTQQQGLLMVAPIAILLFIVVVTLLATMRFAPQFNFMSFGMPMRVAAGTLGLVAFFPEMCAAMGVFMRQIANYGVF
ncbi:MAG: flagellar biosynthetic protein FliR [Fuerstiella sp.]